MPNPGVVAIGATVLGTGASIYGANRAAGATKDASKAANDELARQYDLSRQDLAPYRFGGYQAYNTMLNELGLTPYANPTYSPGTAYGAPAANGSAGGGGFFADAIRRAATRGQGAGVTAAPGQPPVTGTVGSFTASPGYQFVRDEGQRGIMRTAAARGGLSSGATLRALDQFNSGLASQEYGNWWNRLAATSGVGQTATQQGAALGANYANNSAANTMQAGDARASAYLTNAATIGNTINTGLNNWLLYNGGWYTRPNAGG